MTTSNKPKVYLLTGDIGGTNSRMSLYDVSSSKPKVVYYYRNAEHLPEEHLSDPDAFPLRIVAPFLQHCWDTVQNLALLVPHASFYQGHVQQAL